MYAYKIFWSENLKGKDHSEDVDCIHLAQDRNQWLSVLNTVMSLRFL